MVLGKFFDVLSLVMSVVMSVVSVMMSELMLVVILFVSKSQKLLSVFKF